MSFAQLIRDAPKEKIKLKGGLTQGYVVKSEQKISVNKFVPTVGKGSEYAAKFRLEEEREYLQAMASKMEGAGRSDVTSQDGNSFFDAEELTSIGTIPNLRELDREELTQVYDQFSFDPVKPSENLETIHNEKDEILKMIETNPVCIITGPTGCGKSTQIPQFILDTHVKRRAHCNIIVTQPRRIAAITIAQHVCDERGWELGSIVGYQVALDKKLREDTRLLYCTTGVFLEKIINRKELNEYTHIILDEVHEREEDMDFAILVVRRFLRTNSPNVKVILMSATMDSDRFANYFEFCIKNERYPAPQYEIIRENKFTVQVHYLDALKSVGTLPVVTVDEPMIAKEAYNMIPIMIQGFNKIDFEDYKFKRCLDEKGAVLIFLPGLQQIEKLFELLSNEDQKHPQEFNLWLCPLHSSITRDEQEKVRRYAPSGKRKIILSTNIAESSITLTDVKYVIDFCLTKHLVADLRTGFTSLQLSWASHTNCIQREGRVGRVQDGRVYRMVPKAFYMNYMKKTCVPEIQRCPLEILVLKCKKLLEDDCPLKLISQALDPPDLDNYELTIYKLKEIGALLTTCRGIETMLDGDLTFMGRVMGSLPLDIRITKLILLGHLFDVLEDAIIMGCSMSVRNIFSEGFQKRMHSYNNKLLWADSSESDAIAYLNAYLVWRQQTGLGKFQRSVGSEEAWARRYFLQIKHLHEVAKLEDDIKKRLKFFNIQVVRLKGKPLWSPKEKPLILKLVLAGAFYPHYYNTCSEQKENVENEAVKDMAGNNPYTCVYLQNMPHPAQLYLQQVKDSLKNHGVSQDIQFHIDDTRKLVVEFGSSKNSVEAKFGEKSLHSTIPGEIVMPVYRAVKLRQLNETICIRTLNQEEAAKEVVQLNLRSRSSLMSLAGSDYKPQITLYQQHVDLVVTHVDNAGQFYGQVQPCQEMQTKLFEMLNGKVPVLKPLTGDIVDDFIYAAPFKDEGEDQTYYYRAKIIEKLSYEGKTWVEVFFIDFGGCTKLQSLDLKELVSDEAQQELESIPPLAVKCRLAEVGPGIWSAHEGEWSMEANKYVKSTLLNKFWYTKIYSFVHGVANLYLYLEGDLNSDKDPPTLNDDLVCRGFAKYKEELYFSRENHKKRLELEEREYSRMNEEDELNSSMKSLYKEISAAPSTRSRATVRLKGPHSPLEMVPRSMVQCSLEKKVRIEWNSVNSVLLDSDPSDPHDRLLIAGSIGQSPDGNSLTLNHTTVLPNMHGLAALVCLIFAPSVELRTDPNFSRYTGVLCGLGMRSLGCPLFSANDIEITFDVDFTNEDIVDVNKLRYWINQRFCTDYAEDMADHQIVEIQDNLRTLAIKLLKRLRPSVIVYRNPNKFMWGNIPEQRLYDPFPDADVIDCSKFVYKFIRGIDIKAENDYNDVKDLLVRLKSLEQSLANGVALRNKLCELCDVHFDYDPQLRQHIATNHHHHQLVQWLKSRAKQLKVQMPKSATSK